MQRLNGAVVVGQVQGDGGWWLLMEWRGEYVTAWARSLSDPEWVNGHYFRRHDAAVVDYYDRAGLRP